MREDPDVYPQCTEADSVIATPVQTVRVSQQMGEGMGAGEEMRWSGGEGEARRRTAADDTSCHRGGIAPI